MELINPDPVLHTRKAARRRLVCPGAVQFRGRDGSITVALVLEGGNRDRHATRYHRSPVTQLTRARVSRLTDWKCLR
jgi:hypothetical protein